MMWHSRTIYLIGLGLAGLLVALFGLSIGTSPQPARVAAAGEPCAAVNDVRQFITATPAPPRPTNTPAPNPTEPPPTNTPRPAPSEDNVGFPTNYEEEFELLFVFDRPDNRQVRVICGNAAAAAHEDGEPFAYGSVLVMITYRALLDADGQPLLDENGHYIRGSLAGIFVQRKEEGFGTAYGEDQSGEWEYVAYRPDGSFFTPPQNTNACAACHLQQAGEAVDFVFRMEMHHHEAEAFTPPEVDENTVNIFIYEFMPMEFTVKVGTTVTWINNDEADHTIFAKDEVFKSDVLGSVLVAAGATFSYTFDTPGVYDYGCSIHPGMRGKIIVEP
jgi:plastocyanin